ncbi:MAG: hypothetical protein JO325_09005 [Solirubrobacterales bacterium]|nr:hypothetical protein [Solirubrobacterales bacterium]
MTTPFAAARAVSRCLPAGLDAAVQQALHKDGIAAVPAPEFAPKRDQQADRRASPGYGRRGGRHGDRRGIPRPRDGEPARSSQEHTMSGVETSADPSAQPNEPGVR